MSQWNGTGERLGPDGELIDIGVVDSWENEVDGLKGDQDALNEFYRQFPRTTEHAFRDESKSSIFNLMKIYEQIDYNEGSRHAAHTTLRIQRWFSTQIQEVDLK